MIGLRDVLFVAPAAGGGEQPTIPLLPTSAYHVEDHNSRNTTGIHLWQHQQQPPSLNLHPNPHLRKPVALPIATVLDGSGASGVNVALPCLSTSTTTCQDCGNQAKKDCTHRRCRTCCKGRGYDCTTHVKSTWVPAARRREAHLAGAGGSSGSTISASKKPRLTAVAATSNTSNSNTPRSFDTSSGHQEESLPGKVRAPAVFRCVRVTSVGNERGEYAYQAMVRIGGHVFKGFLYDQGLMERDRDGDNDGNKNDGNAIPSLSDLHLGGGASDVYAAMGGVGNDAFTGN